jgi:hypothetical protein
MNYPNRIKLEPDLRGTMEQCGALKGCFFFRETFPQHFALMNQTIYSGEFNDEVVSDRCGPIIGNHFGNSNVDEFGHLFNVPLVRVENNFRNAWKWHIFGNTRMDCTHFCQDIEVWDLVHNSLLEAAQHQFGWQEILYNDLATNAQRTGCAPWVTVGLDLAMLGSPFRIKANFSLVILELITGKEVTSHSSTTVWRFTCCLVSY